MMNTTGTADRAIGTASEQFEKALVDKVITTSEIPLVVIQYPAEGEEAVEEEAIYRNSVLANVTEASLAKDLRLFRKHANSYTITPEARLAVSRFILVNVQRWHIKPLIGAKGWMLNECH